MYTIYNWLNIWNQQHLWGESFKTFLTYWNLPHLLKPSSEPGSSVPYLLTTLNFTECLVNDFQIWRHFSGVQSPDLAGLRKFKNWRLFIRLFLLMFFWFLSSFSYQIAASQPQLCSKQLNWWLHVAFSFIPYYVSIVIAPSCLSTRSGSGISSFPTINDIPSAPFLRLIDRDFIQ